MQVLKRERVHMALNRASNMSGSDWLFKYVKNYHNFSGVVIQFSSLVEIPIKHSSLRDKRH